MREAYVGKARMNISGIHGKTGNYNIIVMRGSMDVDIEGGA